MTSLTLAVAFGLALLIGLALGLLGSGGSIITLPVLVYVAGVPAQRAVGMSLVIVGGTSALGGALNWRRGSFDWRAAGFFAASGMAGAFVGARFTHLVSAAVLLLLFGVLMVAVGAQMLRGREARAGSHECRPVRCLATGVAVGVLTGFLGVGGGFLIVPALVLAAGLEMKPAIGTSLAIIAVNCLGGLFGQLRYTSFDWLLTVGFLIAAMAGMLAGVVLTARLSGQALRRAFGWCVAGLGGLLVLMNLRSLLGAQT